jgi:hypothetical protein
MSRLELCSNNNKCTPTLLINKAIYLLYPTTGSTLPLFSDGGRWMDPRRVPGGAWFSSTPYQLSGVPQYH